MTNSYILPTAFELAVNRIVPVPKQVDRLAGEGLALTADTRFVITAPAAK